MEEKRQVVGDKVHVWNRKCHQVWCGGALEHSHGMAPCPYEGRSGSCPYEYDLSHCNNFYHYLRKVDGMNLYFDTQNGLFYVRSYAREPTDKPVCKYPRETCWERHNGPHILKYHHKHTK